MSALIHDLRQPLSVIETCAAYLRMRLDGAEPDVLEQLECIESQVYEASLMLMAAAGQAVCAAPSTGAAESRDLTNADRTALT